MQLILHFYFAIIIFLNMRAFITISKDNLIHNYFEIKRNTKKEIMAVIKANAYGHGIKEISKELSYINCYFFVVATLQEAIMTRKNLIYAPILLLEDSDDIRVMISLKITLAITNMTQLKRIINTKYPLMIQICIDTDMKRDGLDIGELKEALELIKSSKLKLVGIYTHHTGINEYKKECNTFIDALEKLNNKIFFHHKASSTIMLEDINQNDKHIRIGGALYGLCQYENINLKQVMSLNAPIYSVKPIKKGEAIGYDDGSKADRDGTIISIPFGYSDGWPKYLTICIYYKGRIFKSVGGRMMNHTLFIIDNKYNPKVGDLVELIGSHLTVFELAKMYNMIPYEVTTTLSANLKRTVK